MTRLRSFAAWFRRRLQRLAEPALRNEREHSVHLANQLARAHRHLDDQRAQLAFYRQEDERLRSKLRDAECLLSTLLEIDDLPEVNR